MAKYEIKTLQTKLKKREAEMQGNEPDISGQELFDLAILASYPLTYSYDEGVCLIHLRMLDSEDTDLNVDEKAAAKEKEEKLEAKIDGVKIKIKNDEELSDKLKLESAKKEKHLKDADEINKGLI